MLTRYRSHCIRGLTLVETIVVILVFTLLLVVAIQILLGGINAWKKGQARNDLRATGRQALEQIASDFRQATYTTGNTNVTPAPGASPTAVLSFQRQPQGNTSSGASTDTVTYTIDSSTHSLLRSESGSVNTKVVIASGIVDTTNSYFQWSTDSTTQVCMRINLALVQKAAEAGTLSSNTRETLTLSTSIYQMAYPVAEDTTVEMNGASRTPAAVLTASYSPSPSDLSDPRPLAFR